MQKTALLLRIMAVLILATSLFACSTHRTARDADQWPSNIPPRSYFLKVYGEDPDNKRIQTQEEYLTWILRFYNGWELYRRGWVKMTHELVTQVEDPRQINEITEKMERIGRLVSGEWAKKTDKRTIYVRQVSIWGNALLESIDRNEPLSLVTRVNQDVDDLLAHKINPDIITADRYFPPDENDPFL
jgi:hypothetical protein